MSRTPAAPADDPASTIRLALWAGLLGGMLEVASLAIQKASGEFIYLNRHFPWMAPLGNVGIFLALGLGLTLLGWMVPRARSTSWQVGALATAAVMGVLLAWPQLHRGAVVIMALGVGIQSARWASRSPERVHAGSRRSLPVLLAILLLIGITGEALVRYPTWRALREKPHAKPGAPNVLLLVWDTVRDQNLLSYGYPRRTDPVLDSLARAGVLFRHAIAPAPWTLPSHASFFTGRWPHEHKADWTVALDGRYPVISEAFDSNGYRTGGFAGNTFYCTREYGLSRGFDKWVALRVTPAQILYSAALGRAILNQSWLHHLVREYRPAGANSAAVLNGDLLDWLGQEPDRPFFVYLNYFDAHIPRLVPSPFDRRFGDPATRHLDQIQYSLNHADLRGWLSYSPTEMQAEIDAYDSGIAYMDAQLGQLLDSLRARHLLDNTIVVVTSDHGELFGEHGVAGHGTSVYREAVEVPLVIHAPGRVPTGRVVEEAVTLRDLPATLLDLADQPDPLRLPGTSLSRFIASDSATADSILVELGPQGDRQIIRYPKIGTGMRAVFRDGHEYIRNGDGTEELYAYPADLPQQHDLAGTEAGAAMLPRFRAIVDSLGG